MLYFFLFSAYCHVRTMQKYSEEYMVLIETITYLLTEEWREGRGGAFDDLHFNARSALLYCNRCCV